MKARVQVPVELPSCLEQLSAELGRQEPFQVKPAGLACKVVKAIVGHKLPSSATSFKDCTRAVFASTSIDLVAVAITSLGRHSYRQARLM